MTNKFILILTLFIFLFTGHSQVRAQQIPSPELFSIYNQILDDPVNIDLLYEYAQTAIKIGDFEAAISTLEGMLILSSDQPRIFLELGVLYQRLNAPITARYYLQIAKDQSPADSEVAVLAEEYLQETSQQDSRHQLSGVIGIGLRYQNNPTLSPDSSEILLGGFDTPLPEKRRRQSDVNGLLFSHAQHSYQLTPQTSLASTGTLFATFYDKNSQLNLASVELLSGPLFESEKNASGYYGVHPHIVLRGSSLDGEVFEKTKGLGIDLMYTPVVSAWTTPHLKIRYQFRDVTFEDFNNLGGAPLYSGNEHTIDLRLTAEIRRGHLIDVGLLGQRRDTERQYLDVDQYALSARYSIKIDNVFFQKRPKMTVSPYISGTIQEYGGPDPTIDPQSTRRDKEWRIGFRYHLPVTKSQAFILNMEHQMTDSNIINYDTKNNMAMVIYQKGF